MVADMKIFIKCLFFMVFAVVFIVGDNGESFAESKKSSVLFWPWAGEENVEFTRYYLHDGKTRHARQWQRIMWHPDDWAVQIGGYAKMIDGFYKSGILVDQYEELGVPVLAVGKGFHELGGFDKRRITEIIDIYYQITPRSGGAEHGMYRIFDANAKRYIGSYSSYGLVLQ